MFGLGFGEMLIILVITLVMCFAAGIVLIVVFCRR